MTSEIRQQISENYDGSAWESVTGILWQDGKPWQLRKFEEIVEYEGCLWQCLVVTKIVFDADDIGAVDYCEDILSEAWELS